MPSTNSNINVHKRKTTNGVHHRNTKSTTSNQNGKLKNNAIRKASLRTHLLSDKQKVNIFVTFWDIQNVSTFGRR